MGKLGWTEYEYYTSSEEAFYFGMLGYYEKLQDQSLAVRNAATMIYRVMGGKEDINKIWKLRGVESTSGGFETPTKEWWLKMKETHKKIDANLKFK